MLKNNKKRGEKSIAIFEIFVLTISILAISYFIGTEFKLVSSADTTPPADTTDDICDSTHLVNCLTSTKCAKAGGHWYDDICNPIEGEPITPPTSTDDGTEGDLSSLLEDAAGLLPTVASAVIPRPSGTPADKAGLLSFLEQLGGGTPTALSNSGAAVGDAEIAKMGAGISKLAAEQFWAGALKIGAGLIGNAIIATGLYFGGRYLGELMFGTGSPVAEDLGLALSLGYGIGAGLGTIMGTLLPDVGFFTTFTAMGGFISLSWLGLIGLGVGLIIWFFTAQDERMDTVMFTCSTWQPKSGGADCEKCNQGQLPCTKYKCQSLGASCELINEGTDEEFCNYNDRNDITPPIISSWSEPLTEGYSYVPESATLPADETGSKGVTIKYTGAGSDSKGCIPPFKIINYGISLNKPGKCKMDTIRKDNFADMDYDLSQGYSVYNHTLRAFSPGLVEAESERIPIPNGGNYEISVRCESRNGVSNTGTFVFKFCVQSEPDITAPTIVSTDPLNGMPFNSGMASQNVNFYVDKPSDCKWDHNDVGYDSMANEMTCAQGITDIGTNMLYKCSTTLTGLLSDVENNFYVKCKSYPLMEEADRTTMVESYVYKLAGTQPLVIDSVEPVDASTIKDSTESVKVTLKAQTSAGFKDGEAWCSYNETSNPTSRNYILFANTNSYQHSQELWLGEGDYEYSIKCCDLGNNCDIELTGFEVESDNNAPIVVRVYNEVQELKLVTNENADCVYDVVDCNYNFDEGIKLTTMDGINHYTEWSVENNFFIKCKDAFGNVPAPNQCSVIARPFSSY